MIATNPDPLAAVVIPVVVFVVAPTLNPETVCCPTPKDISSP
jgi:hypothetical protein